MDLYYSTSRIVDTHSQEQIKGKCLSPFDFDPLRPSPWLAQASTLSSLILAILLSCFSRADPCNAEISRAQSALA